MKAAIGTDRLPPPGHFVCKALCVRCQEPRTMQGAMLSLYEGLDDGDPVRSSSCMEGTASGNHALGFLLLGSITGAEAGVPGAVLGPQCSGRRGRLTH